MFKFSISKEKERNKKYMNFNNNVSLDAMLFALEDHLDFFCTHNKRKNKSKTLEISKKKTFDNIRKIVKKALQLKNEKEEGTSSNIFDSIFQKK